MNGLELFDGAQPAGPFALRFAEPAAEAALALRETIAVPLVHLALLEATGADASTFLQGQLSNDVRQVDGTRAQLSSYNSPKGRMLAVLHLWRRDEGFRLETQRAIADAVLKRLRMFVLRAKVRLGESSDLVALGLAGPAAESVLAALGLPRPTAPLEVATAGDVTVTRRLGAHPRWSLLASPARAAELWPALRERAAPAGTQAWQLLDVLAGVPAVYPETQDRFVPQMCNLDRLGGISFDKGCYTGQEIVARVHYRGAVKRHMTMLRTLESGVVPGTSLALPDGRAAEVVESAPHPDGGTAALVVAGGAPP